MKSRLVIGLLLSAVASHAYEAGKFYSQGKTKEKVIALTFDDGPGPYTPRILELLKQHHIRATFYVEGSQIEEYPEIMRQVKDAGHEIGSHTYNHFNFNDPKHAFKDRFVHEVRQTETTLRRALKDPDYRMPSLRMPYGAFGKNNRAWLLPTLKENGYALVHWSFGTDWHMKMSAEEMAQAYIQNAKPGAVFLFHDGGRKREKTLIAVTTVVETLEKEGYRFIAADEMFK
jgi:peptidoglycan/xylan/chitin deacetylase (PgdA/CDA1 family)